MHPAAAAPATSWAARRAALPLDLGDEDAAALDGGIAVDGAERVGRVLRADVGGADLADDAALTDEEDAAVVGVGNGERPVGSM